MKTGLEHTPNIRPATAFKILASGPESLPPKTAIKLLAERMRHQMQQASMQAGTSGVINLAEYRKARFDAGRRKGSTQMIPPSGRDNYGAYAPLARREMI
jgi:hypothetical protein